MGGPATDVTARHYRGTDPLNGEPIEFWVSGETIGHTPIADAETAVDGGWILPGLVDAHNHVGIAPGLGVDIEQAQRAVDVLHTQIIINQARTALVVW